MGVEHSINPQRLKGKIAVITGGNKGIGRAISLRFAQEGASNVMILSRSNADGVVSEVTALGAQAIWIPCDVASEQSLVHAVEEVKATGKKIDILVNNAGISERELGARAYLIGSTKREDVQRIMETNYVGPYMLSTHLLKRDLFAHDEPGSVAFLQQADTIPSIINIASFLGLHSFPLQEKYNASKAAMIAWTKSYTSTIYLQHEYFVRVNAVCPGFIVTDMTNSVPPNVRDILAHSTPLRRFGLPEEVAGIVAHLASDEARFVTGMQYVIDGGLGGGVSAAYPLSEDGFGNK